MMRYLWRAKPKRHREHEPRAQGNLPRKDCLGSYVSPKLLGAGKLNLHSHDGNDSSLYITARVPSARVKFNRSLIGHYTNNKYPAPMSKRSTLHSK